MRIAICDDNKADVARIKHIISEFYEEYKLPVPEIDEYYSGDSLLSDPQKKDLVFLDIEMPGQDGICTGRKLLERDRSIILIMVTSFGEYLDDAMRINVFRYISKPIDSKRVKRNLADALNAYNVRSEKEIIIDSPGESISLNSSDILMIEFDNRKVKIHTIGETIPSTLSLQEWKEKLPESLFYQCHRSFIVNLSHIRKILSDKIIMDKEGTEAYLTKRKHSEIKRLWMLYIESAY